MLAVANDCAIIACCARVWAVRAFDTTAKLVRMSCIVPIRASAEPRIMRRLPARAIDAYVTKSVLIAATVAASAAGLAASESVSATKRATIVSAAVTASVSLVVTASRNVR